MESFVLKTFLDQLTQGQLLLIAAVVLVFIVVLRVNSYITQAIIDWHKASGNQIAWVTRPLEFSQAEYGIPQLLTEITTEEINAGIEKIRQFYYASTTDPLFFKAQRGECTTQEWLDAVAAVKAEYPKI